MSGGCCSYAAVLPDANFPDIHPEGSPGFSDPHAPHPTCPGTLAPLITLWLAGANLLSLGACGGPWKATADATLPPTRHPQEKHRSVKSQFQEKNMRCVMPMTEPSRSLDTIWRTLNKDK